MPLKSSSKIACFVNSIQGWEQEICAEYSNFIQNLDAV
eukprot:CAMPEP_0178848276 /NCGR_PEP_ID=MMETSP0746-20121128/19215_1 /TAXON_ID=913974 /ORGANISM="Nitzschia punctata, Strain CCMP561" /LENGTH=37 /DNA_ID= /DNA_START= /DNA_END= /DNA_ORIENTATION=